MKKLLLLFLFLTFQIEAAVTYLPGEYTVDPAHTRVEFLIRHFTISIVEGRFNDVKGVLILAPKFENSSVEAVVDINSIDTAVKQRDDDLRSANFFDVTKYPSMSLKSKKFSGKPAAFTLKALLTIKDVTKEVTFKGAYTGVMSDPWGNDRVALNMTTKINRKDFHINYDEKVSNGPGIGDEVTIIVRGDGIKKANAK